MHDAYFSQAYIFRNACGGTLVPLWEPCARLQGHGKALFNWVCNYAQDTRPSCASCRVQPFSISLSLPLSLHLVLYAPVCVLRGFRRDLHDWHGAEADLPMFLHRVFSAGSWASLRSWSFFLVTRHWQSSCSFLRIKRGNSEHQDGAWEIISIGLAALWRLRPRGGAGIDLMDVSGCSRGIGRRIRILVWWSIGCPVWLLISPDYSGKMRLSDFELQGDRETAARFGLWSRGYGTRCPILRNISGSPVLPVEIQI